MQSRLTRWILVLSVVCGLTLDHTAWSMGHAPPMYLHQLLAQADLVAIATVTESTYNSTVAQPQATLQIERVIQGKVEGKQAVVENVDPDGCMGPSAKYVIGERVLVFLALTNKDKNDHYSTCGVSSGTRVLDDQQLAACIQRAKEFYKIREMEDDVKRKRNWTEWAVRCAEEPSTRTDAFALLYRGTFGKAVLPDDSTPYRPLLDHGQQDRLFATLKQIRLTDESRYDAMRLMKVIAFTLNDESLLRTANKIRRLLLPHDGNRPKKVQDIAGQFDVLSNAFVDQYNRLRKAAK